MTLEDNKALACRWLDLISAHDIEGLIQMSTADWTMEGGPPGLPAGAEGLRALFASIGPVEQTWTLQHVVAEGDFVVLRALNRCVQEEFFGVPAAGKPQLFSATFILRIERGKVAQTWRNADDLGRLLQLGARIVPG